MLIRSENILAESFYLRPTLTVARELLGKILVHQVGPAFVAGRIVETEAYHQDGDASSHTYRGQTERNEVMFRKGGVLYVYFTYGMHFCMNVVTEAEGIGAAALIRAIEPLEGLDIIQARRGKDKKPFDLTNGPAKCTQAFGIDRRHNGASLRGPELYILDAPEVDEDRIGTSPRIGISSSRELEWRFFLKGVPFVSGRNRVTG
jgi:DNA-3-methyladenine glycosylase